MLALSKQPVLEVIMPVENYKPLNCCGLHLSPY